MSSPFRPITITEATGWFRTSRPAVLFLLSGLCSPAISPAWAQTAAAPAALAAPVAPVERMEIDDPYTGYVADAAQRFVLPAAWIRAVIAAESNGDPHARSPKGAMG